jgi:hypothetical protein
LQAEHAQLFDEGEKNEKARMSILTKGRVTDLLPKVLEDLNQEGISTNTTVNKLESKNTFFLPHFNSIKSCTYMYHRQ